MEQRLSALVQHNEKELTAMAERLQKLLSADIGPPPAGPGRFEPHDHPVKDLQRKISARKEEQIEAKIWLDEVRDAPDMSWSLTMKQLKILRRHIYE
jgi:hypothetical protein